MLTIRFLHGRFFSFFFGWFHRILIMFQWMSPRHVVTSVGQRCVVDVSATAPRVAWNSNSTKHTNRINAPTRNGHFGVGQSQNLFLQIKINDLSQILEAPDNINHFLHKMIFDTGESGIDCIEHEFNPRRQLLQAARRCRHKVKVGGVG